MPDDIKMPQFSRADLEEIYYALDTKVGLIQNGHYGPEDNEGDDEEWIQHFKNMMAMIERSLNVPGVFDWWPKEEA